MSSFNSYTDRSESRPESDRSSDRERDRDDDRRRELDRDYEHHDGRYTNRDVTADARDREYDRDEDNKYDRSRDNLEKTKSRERDYHESEKDIKKEQATPDIIERSRGRERSRDHERSRERSRDRDRERSRDVADRERSRDRDRDRDRDRERQRSRDSDKDRPRDRHDRDRERDRDRRDKRDRARDSELSDEEHRQQLIADDIRNFISRERRALTDEDMNDYMVFVTQLHPKVDERCLFEFFSLVGRVNDIRLIRDDRTKRSKGIAYVEFASKECPVQAISLSGQPIYESPITIQPLPKTLAKADEQTRLEKLLEIQSRTLSLAKLPFSIRRTDLKQVLDDIGQPELLHVIRVTPDEAIAHICFAQVEQTQLAKDALCDLELLGSKIEVYTGKYIHPAIKNCPVPNEKLLTAKLYTKENIDLQTHRDTSFDFLLNQK